MLLTFSIFRPPSVLADYRQLEADIHSHLLPGIDDGAKDVRQSLLLLKGLNEIGFSRCYATPHISEVRFPNTSQTIKAAEQKVAAASLQSSQGFAGVAAEYLLDSGFENKLAQGALLTLPNNRLLIEMPFAMPAENVEDTLFSLAIQGYNPILAHPERYRYWAHKLTRFKRLEDLGCEFQVNLLSLLGYYGKTARRAGYELIEHHGARLLGTDCHNLQQLNLLKAGLKDRRLAKLFNRFHFDNSKIK
ncbi:MAG: CpsB/CapC family capsule biosynthesis tyrosine phosphatase [Bacteroidota bacterium]